MEHAQLFIAPKIRVGFQKRSDTYTEKLAYVIYYDLKGVLRKEKSWESWRDKNIEPVEFDNVPTEGFVLNKKVGGGRSDWNVRQEYVRVYDPRNFEFEITVPNLLFILRECDCSRGKGLDGKFVYAWSGTTLLLLPVSSEEYKKSAGYTNLQAKTIKAKELIKGASYLTKKQEALVFIDRRLKYNSNLTSWKSRVPVERVYVFWDINHKHFVFMNDVKCLAAVISDTAPSNYAELVASYDKSAHGSPPVRLFTKEQPKWEHNADRYWYSHSWSKESGHGVFHQYETRYLQDGSIDYVSKVYEVSLKDGTDSKYLNADRSYEQTYRGPSYNRRGVTEPTYMTEQVDLALWVELSSGSTFEVNGSSLTAPGEDNGKD